MTTEKQVTQEQVEAAVRPESVTPQTVKVGGRDIAIKPMAYRWQVLFWQAAVPIFEENSACLETILKDIGFAIESKSMPVMSFSREICATVVSAAEKLGRAGAVILASQDPEAKADPQKAIAAQQEWIDDHARIEELRALVEAQMDIENLVQSVGKASPVRFEELLQALPGAEGANQSDSLKRVLTSLSSKSPETSTGDGA